MTRQGWAGRPGRHVNTAGRYRWLCSLCGQVEGRFVTNRLAVHDLIAHVDTFHREESKP